jgi:hypothetical protein
VLKTLTALLMSSVDEDPSFITDMARLCSKPAVLSTIMRVICAFRSGLFLYETRTLVSAAGRAVQWPSTGQGDHGRQ